MSDRWLVRLIVVQVVLVVAAALALTALLWLLSDRRQAAAPVAVRAPPAAPGGPAPADPDDPEASSPALFEGAKVETIGRDVISSRLVAHLRWHGWTVLATFEDQKQARRASRGDVVSITGDVGVSRELQLISLQNARIVEIRRR